MCWLRLVELGVEFGHGLERGHAGLSAERGGHVEPVPQPCLRAEIAVGGFLPCIDGGAEEGRPGGALGLLLGYGASTLLSLWLQNQTGFAMGAGSDVAIETAGVTLMKSDLMAVADAIDLSRHTMKKIRQNLFFAFIYNILGIPLAALGGLNPVIAGAAMAMSSVSVVSNALLLRRWRPAR